MRWGIEKNPRSKLERTADRGEYVSDRKMNFESASRKKEKVLADAIKERNFIGVYPREEVEKDLKYIKEAENAFKEKAADEESARGVELAHIFEAIICHQGELANWFGENSMTIKSARYDDLKNGVDLIIEFTDNDDKNSHLALAVDVTFSSFEKLYEKLDGIKTDIEDGKLAYVKYFESERSGIKGDIKGIPKTVIGADPRTLYKLMDLWVGGKEKELEKHPIQFMILDQIMAQLIRFKELAESNKKSFIADKYEKAIETVGRILNEKQELREEVLGSDESVLMNDRVHQEIIGYTEKMSMQKGPRIYKY
jgi:hypothetical protein